MSGRPPQTEDRSYIVYDGDCPFCSQYIKMVRLREAFGNVELVNARQAHPVLLRLQHEGYDLNEGMALVTQDRIWFGEECIHKLALITTPVGAFNWLSSRVFRNRLLSRLLYPIMRFGRNQTLRLMGRKKI